MESIKSDIKNISNRARVAFCATCLEIALENFGIRNILIERVISKVWEFTSSGRLDVWDGTMKEYSPHVILDTHPDNVFQNYVSVNLDEYNDLKLLYKSLPSSLVDAIGDSIEVGGCNLYVATGAYSECSFVYVLNVCNFMKKNKLSLPDINRFKVSPFSEADGWGIPRERSMW